MCWAREAADLLLEHAAGRLPPEPQRRLMPMRLISRLTSRLAWSRDASLAQLVALR
jgi:DNA-binding LacI/PurR family transcriptional regulator